MFTIKAIEKRLRRVVIIDPDIYHQGDICEMCVVLITMVKACTRVVILDCNSDNVVLTHGYCSSAAFIEIKKNIIKKNSNRQSRPILITITLIFDSTTFLPSSDNSSA